MSKLEELEHSLRDPAQSNMIQRIDNVLFSHGGLSAEYIKWFDKSLLYADIDDVIEAVNNAFHDQLWNDESPLWLRPQHRARQAFRKEKYIQVVGHTPVERVIEKDGFISVDVFSTHPDGTPIGEPAMIVIDSKTRIYEKVEVAGK